MTNETKDLIIDYLRNLENGQATTIEQIIRHLGSIKGEKFTFSEMQLYEQFENYLIKEGIIIDSGNTTKLYNYLRNHNINDCK